jgi:NTP pyrophosphatase (non-canonical NTP hydrolase)|tara:strand:- start:233 stop:502 length:270 start_codon:yes stop_codon:yes gene_type:complete
MEKYETYSKIHDQCGYPAMLDKWIEELLELLTILQQSKSKDINVDDLVKEVADVSIIVEQIAHVHDLHNEVVHVRKDILKNLPNKLGLV